jgi:hypothetical protein
VAGRLRVGFSHHDIDGAARVTGAGSPPFAPIDDIVIAMKIDLGNSSSNNSQNNIEITLLLYKDVIH